MKNKTEIMKSVNGVASKTIMKLKKHSPEILVVAGIAGTVVSAVLACKATTKVAEILDETKGTLDTIHEGMKTGAINGQEYTTEDGKKDTVVVYAQTGMKARKALWSRHHSWHAVHYQHSGIQQYSSQAQCCSRGGLCCNR
ncbi:MAG: DUF6353 family protein [[Clostridium] scindens]